MKYKTRNESIDVIKGILILLVIVGHILLGSLDENGLRYYIYSFHMPVFFYVSGFLINLDKLSSESPFKLIAAYWKRMLFPWFIALVVYTVFLSLDHFTIHEIAIRFIHPFYHLWYVPSLFIFIVITWILRRIKDDELFFFFLVSIGLLLINTNISLFEFRLSFFVYFIAGIVVQKLQLQNNHILIGGGVFLIYSIVILILFMLSVKHDYYVTYLRLPCMLLICTTSVQAVINSKKLHSLLLSFVGRNSLEIYLWHVLPLVFFKHFFKDLQLVYYLFSFGLLTLFIVLVWIKTNSSLFRK